MAANTDFRAIIRSGDEDKLVEFLHSDEFEKNPVGWFPADKSPFMTVALVNVHFLELIIDRLHELGVLEEVCATRLDVSMNNRNFEKQIVRMTLLQCVIEIRNYNAITPLLKYPECWKALCIASTQNKTAVSTCILRTCLPSSVHTLMGFEWLEKLLGKENPYLNVCLRVYEKPEINPIDKVFNLMDNVVKEQFGSRQVNQEALTQCKELVALRRSENGSLTKRAVSS